MQVEIVGVRDAVIGKALQSGLPENARAFLVATLGAMEQRQGRALRARVRMYASDDGDDADGGGGGGKQRTRFSVEIDEFDARSLIGKTDREAL